MSTVQPLAIVIDPDLGLLSRATRVLSGARYQILTRLSPAGLPHVVRTLRPELILLGLSFWDQGWGPLLGSASPETVVLPFGDRDEGAVDPSRLRSLVA